MKSFFTFPAIRGKQAQKEYFVAMVSLYELSMMKTSMNELVVLEKRTQRTLKKSRIPQIKEYIISNVDSYVFSALTMSVMGEIDFHPYDGQTDSGELKIPMNTKFLVNDGQHRLAAIKEALNDKPELGNEHISLVLFSNDTIQKAQQRFADLNRYASRPTKSINILFDSRKEIDLIVKEVVDKVECFRGQIEKEKISLSGRSKALFTLSAVGSATEILLNGINLDYQNKLSFAIDFWNTVSECMPEWNEIKTGEKKASDVRASSVNLLGITLYAIGAAGNAVYNKYPGNWKDYILKLQYFDWNRNNEEWSVFLIREADSNEKKVVANRSAKKNLTTLITNKILESDGEDNG